MKPTRPRPWLRRPVLGALALAAFAAPAVASGCAAGFAPISQVEGLRVLGVVPQDDGAYVVPCAATTPGCTAEDVAEHKLPPGASVTFQMYSEYTGSGDVEIAWLGGCVNPAGDQYFACYGQLAEVVAELAPFFQSGDPADIPPDVIGKAWLGKTFTMSLPRDLVSSRAPQPGLPHYGVAYAFFMACAGHLGPAAGPDGGPDPGDGGGGGLAGSFPIGCYDDATGHAVTADRFVPGYTLVYAFADGYENKNPPVCSVSVKRSDGAGDGGEAGDDGGTTPGCAPDDADAGAGPEVYSAPYCDVSNDARNASGCGKTDPYQRCTSYDVTVEVPDTVADVDAVSGQYETVWVDYFADLGDIDSPVLLVSDAVPGSADAGSGIQRGKFKTRWIPPPPPPPPDAGADAADGGSGAADGGVTAGPEKATVWAVVHDSRGGSTVVSRQITLEQAP